MRTFALVSLCLLSGSAFAADLPDGFYRQPSIGGGVVVFVAEGDLWKVPLAGGVATRLTAYEGDERNPHVSPDGRYVAFTAEYEGDADVYVMATSGGEPRRLTFHPGTEEVIGWTPDGKILYRERYESPHNDFHMHTVAPDGGLPQTLPLEPAAWVAMEPGGKRVALQKMGLETKSWKRYRGGQAEQIEVGTLAPLAFARITKFDGKNAFPMWAKDGRIYFVTDRWGRPNLASMTPDGGDVKQLTKFDDFDVRWPSLGDDKIVYQHKMDLWIDDLATGKNEALPIQLPSDRLQERERVIDPMAYRGHWGLSRDGARIVIDARGDLFVARTRRKGLIRRISESSLARTKDPAFSPDGKWVAAWSEVKGEEQLVLFSADASAPSRQLGSVPPGWHFPLAWSSDGKRIAWSDEKHQLNVTDTASGKITVVDRASREIRHSSWSPDGRYLAYTVAIPSEQEVVRVWDAQNGRVHEVTDPLFDSYAATWDPRGKYLYFLSDRYFNPYRGAGGGLGSFIIDKPTLPYAMALRADVKLPFAPRGDVDTVAEKEADKKEEATSLPAGGRANAPAPVKDEKPKPLAIDFDGIAERIVQFPVPPGDYSTTRAIDGKLLWLVSADRGMRPADQNGGGAELVSFDLDTEKVSVITGGVTSYEVSLDNHVLVYQARGAYLRMDAGATSAPHGEGPDDPHVDLAGWSMRINPRQEWQQILHEAWRLERDFFYDPKMHGVDWNGVWKQYGPLAARIASRDDLDDLIGEILGELSVGHAYHGGGDAQRGRHVRTGLLGADLAYDAATGFLQLKKIYRGDYPDPANSSPLARPDLHVSAGMWLVAIDGKPLAKGEPWELRLAGRADEDVELSINTAPRLPGARRIIIKTISDETSVRYATWVRDNRDYVSRASHGEIGYIHLYDMGALGLAQFARDYASQWDKRGLIIDDRWNHGGFVAPIIIAHLMRPIFSIVGTRQGLEHTDPERAFHGYLVALVNRQGGSNCEALVQEFKDQKLGPVIGTRTWGGYVGIRGFDKPLRDGGGITEPEYGSWDVEGKAWRIEGHGVDPDVELDLGPDGLIDGNDVQLDYAIKDLQTKIAKDPRRLPGPPAIGPR